MDPLSNGGILGGFVTGVAVTALSLVVLVPPGADTSQLANSASGSGTAGATSAADDGTAGDGSGGSGSSFFFGDGEEGEEATGVGDGGADASAGSTGGSSPTGTTGGEAGTTGGEAGTTGSEAGTTDGGTTGTSGTSGTTGTSGTSGTTDTTGTGGGGTSTTGGSSGGTSSGGTTSESGGGTSGGGSGDVAAACEPGRNGGQTDTGVTGDRILLGATVAESGVARSFLGEARVAMNAVVRRVNKAGGICGRQLEVLYKDDGWDAETGFEYIKSLVEGEQVFALAVVPSSEGLNEASDADYLERKKVPVVGSDGMIRTQYTDPYIFPVATATVSIMHIMAADAWERFQAQGVAEPNFGIVYEQTYRFGVEGAYAFNQSYKRLSGGDIPGYSDPFTSPKCESGTQFCAVPANASGGYGDRARNFKQGCEPGGLTGGSGDRCDFMALLLEPDTALSWFKANDAPDANCPNNDSACGKMAAAPPLFTKSFGEGCGGDCDDMWIWTGYNPPIEHYAEQAGVKRYVADLHAVKKSADEFNQFSEGAYLGMAALVEAMARTGPNLTREGLRQTLYGMEFDIGLSPTLDWESGNHFANRAAQAFQIEYENQFRGYAFARDYIADPWLGEDVGS